MPTHHAWCTNLLVQALGLTTLACVRLPEIHPPKAPVGREMGKAFQEDKRPSLEVTKEAWRLRSRGSPIKEWAGRMLEHWH